MYLSETITVIAITSGTHPGEDKGSTYLNILL
jgi:hypothetical protein